ncbi:MAG TPA: hypothetical protein VHO06_12675 [Polyangia bacterium]|nr:hypothetical protein [Polyangia bacterium]
MASPPASAVVGDGRPLQFSITAPKPPKIIPRRQGSGGAVRFLTGLQVPRGRAAATASIALFVTAYGQNGSVNPYHWTRYVYGILIPGWAVGGPNPDASGVDPPLVALQALGTPAGGRGTGRPPSGAAGLAVTATAAVIRARRRRRPRG